MPRGPKLGNFFFLIKKENWGIFQCKQEKQGFGAVMCRLYRGKLPQIWIRKGSRGTGSF